MTGGIDLSTGEQCLPCDPTLSSLPSRCLVLPVIKNEGLGFPVIGFGILLLFVSILEQHSSTMNTHSDYNFIVPGFNEPDQLFFFLSVTNRMVPSSVS